MAIFAYEPWLRMSFSDDPSLFKNEEDAQAKTSLVDVRLIVEEWQTYYVKFYADPAPSSLKQSLEKANAVRVIQPDFWELNFRNFVGLSRLGALNLQILNKKISDELYQTLLDELAEKYSTLVFSFASPVGQHYKKDGVGNDSAFVEYLFLRKFLLHGSPDIDAISDILVYGPHRKFEKELQSCSIEECRQQILQSSMPFLAVQWPDCRTATLSSRHILAKFSRPKPGMPAIPSKQRKK